MARDTRFREQLRRNAVALISLVIAITSLGYNTWRNEVSEYNRSQRLVSIQLLLLIGELRQLTMDMHYTEHLDEPMEMGMRRVGWSKVLTIRDLAQVADGGIPEASTILFDTWNSDYKRLVGNVDAKDRVITAIESVRNETHSVLKSLD